MGTTGNPRNTHRTHTTAVPAVTADPTTNGRRNGGPTGQFCHDTCEMLLTEITESTKFENTSQVQNTADSTAHLWSERPLFVLPPGSLPSQQVLS
jgi:hypothetical protein